MTNGNDAAFASPGWYENPDIYVAATEGLTKREYFAAMAMQGIVAGQPYKDYAPAMLSAQAVAYADALIAALNK